MEICKILIDKIEQLCQINNIKVNQLLSKCGLSKDVVNNMKKEKPSIPSVDKIKIIAEFFNVSTDYLLGLDDVPNKKEKISVAELTSIEKECLNAFNNLIPEDRIRFISRMEQRYEDYTPEQKENVS